MARAPGDNERGRGGRGDDSGRQRQVVRPEMVRTGVTSFAVLAGLSCYVLLAQWQVNQVVAGVIGFAFALVVRVAAGSLVRDWLASVRGRAQEGANETRAQEGWQGTTPTRRDGGRGR